MRALWSDRPNCSHNVSQKVKRIRRLSEFLGGRLRAAENATHLKRQIPGTANSLWLWFRGCCISGCTFFFSSECTFITKEHMWEAASAHEMEGSACLVPGWKVMTTTTTQMLPHVWRSWWRMLPTAYLHSVCPEAFRNVDMCGVSSPCSMSYMPLPNTQEGALSSNHAPTHQSTRFRCYNNFMALLLQPSSDIPAPSLSLVLLRNLNAKSS